MVLSALSAITVSADNKLNSNKYLKFLPKSYIKESDENNIEKIEESVEKQTEDITYENKDEKSSNYIFINEEPEKTAKKKEARPKPVLEVLADSAVIATVVLVPLCLIGYANRQRVNENLFMQVHYINVYRPWNNK